MKFKLFAKFPFIVKSNTLCFTCCHILNENKRVRYVSHDNDGDWQFLCGEKHSPADARIVSLSEIITLDKNVVELSDLECGEYAEEKDEKWIIYKQNS